MVDFSIFEEAEFSVALQDAIRHGTLKKLLELLRSDHPMTAEDKRALADFIEGKTKRRIGRPATSASLVMGRDLLDTCAAEVRFRKEEFRAQTGRRKAPHRKIVATVAEELGVSVDALLMRCKQSQKSRLAARNKRKYSSF